MMALPEKAIAPALASRMPSSRCGAARAFKQSLVTRAYSKAAAKNRAFWRRKRTRAPRGQCRANTLAWKELLGGLRNELTLKPRPVELIRARLALPLATRDGGRTIGTAARDLIELHLALKAVGQADNHQAQVQQVGDDREEGRFLATVLGCRRGKGAAHFSVQRAFHPQTAGLIQEGGHLRRHPSEARWSTDDDGVVIGELVDRCDRSFLVELEVRGFCYVSRNCLRNTLEVHSCARRARAFSDCIRHRFDVTVRGVVEDEDACHGICLGYRGM